MKIFKASRFALNMMEKIAPAAWAEEVEKLSAEQRNEVMVCLSNLTQRAALARGYLDGRYLYSQRDHSQGVKAANGLRTKVRKALGYAYPKQDFSF